MSATRPVASLSHEQDEEHYGQDPQTNVTTIEMISTALTKCTGPRSARVDACNLDAGVARFQP